jgi:F-type H+-transporting ATPase subunit delta
MKQISKKYAEALFELACEQGNEQAIMEGLHLVRTTLEQHPDYMELLSSPTLPTSERCACVEQTFTGLLPDAVISLLCLMCERGRIRSFAACVDEYKRLLDIKQSVITAKVTSAVPLNEDEKAALTQNLQKKSGATVLLCCAVDASIMGGVIVEMEGTIMDGSLRQRLRQVKEVMKE